MHKLVMNEPTMDNFEYRGETLHAEDIDLNQIAKQFGTQYGRCLQFNEICKVLWKVVF